MMRIIFSLLLLIHSGIHIIGFIKNFPISKSVHNKISKLTKFLWLFSFLLFSFSSILFLIKKEEWWMFGLPSILFSQTLIFLFWKDAKFGTIVNIIIFLGALISFGQWNFNFRLKDEVKSFNPKYIDNQKSIPAKILADLPPIIQKWLAYSKVINKPMIHKAHLKQKGEMRTKENGSWMNVKAEQYFTIDKPGFIWIADVEAAPGIHLYGKDKYEEGHGNMQIQLFGLLKVADSKGKETDQGTLLRFLAETIWFPSAALNNYIFWEVIDSLTAKATMTYKGSSASGVFKFSPNGEVTSFEALRYYDRKEGHTLEKWFINVDVNSFKEFEGIIIPSKSSVTWKLKSGDFTWYKLEVTEVKYNK